MDIEEIKSKFFHKSVADVKDVDLALRAAPFLIRELVKVQEELTIAEERIEHLQAKFRKKPPSEKQGQRGDAKWDIKLDEKKNRLYAIFQGVFDHRSGKTSTQCINMVLENARNNFDAIVDFSGLSADANNRVAFHFRKAFYTIEQLGVKTLICITDPKFSKINTIIKELAKNDNLDFSTSKSLDDAVLALDNAGKFLKA